MLHSQPPGPITLHGQVVERLLFFRISGKDTSFWPPNNAQNGNEQTENLCEIQFINYASNIISPSIWLSVTSRPWCGCPIMLEPQPPTNPMVLPGSRLADKQLWARHFLVDAVEVIKRLLRFGNRLLVLSSCQIPKNMVDGREPINFWGCGCILGKAI